MSGITIVANAGSGTGFAADACQRFENALRRYGLASRLVLARGGAQLIEAAREAAQGDAQTVVAAGGDGTVNAVASTLPGTQKRLAVLPLGTFNYFARSLRIPLDVEAAANTVAEGHVAAVNLGEVNGHCFINNSSIGLYPDILREREKEYRRFGRSQFIAYLSVAVTLLRPKRTVSLRIVVDGESFVRKTPLLFVGRNQYQMDEFGIRCEHPLPAGCLAFYVVRPVARWRLAALALRTLRRRLRGAEELEMLCAHEAWIETRRKRLSVALDGELAVLIPPLHYRLHSHALQVLVPRAIAE